MQRLVSILLLLAVFTWSTHGDVWTQFRGGQAGKLSDVQHPVQWSKDDNLAWAIPMQGSGWSSPLVVGDRIFLTSARSENAGKPKGMMAGVASMRSFRNAKPDKHQFVVSCYQLTDGKELWSKIVTEKIPSAVHPSNTYATESPATDGTRLFTFFATTGSLTAWDFNGNELWTRELGSYRSGNGFGTGSSLASVDGKVFVQYDNDESSFVAAFEAETGEQAWRDDRPAKTSWSTPLVWSHQSGKELVTCGSNEVTSYDPASGKVIWKVVGMQSGFSASPAIGVDRIFFGMSGPMSPAPLVAVNAGLTGEVTLTKKFKSDQVAWSKTGAGPGMASPVVSNGLLYIPGSNAILNCYDVESGERVYRTRVQGMKTVAASLWADQDRVFILDENGTTFVVKSGREFELLGKNELDDLVWSTPTVAGDTLLIRGVDKLYCIRK